MRKGSGKLNQAAPTHPRNGERGAVGARRRAGQRFQTTSYAHQHAAQRLHRSSPAQPASHSSLRSHNPRRKGAETTLTGFKNYYHHLLYYYLLPTRLL